VLLSLSFCHLLNDMIQSLVPALYPILKANYGLDFGQVGLITLAFQCTASLLQPLVGVYTDRHPLPYSLPAGMASTLVGLLMLSQASSYPVILGAAALIGVGSSVFHPESSRVARLASGGRYGLAQSLFQVGGNFGSAVGPLLAAFIVAPQGQGSIVWFSILGVLPFTLALPYVGLPLTVVLTVVIGLIMSSAFSAILVYAQDLLPGKVGLVAGLFFGFSFGLGGLGAAALGELADRIGIDAVYGLCSFLPLLGILTALLPKIEHRRKPG